MTEPVLPVPPHITATLTLLQFSIIEMLTPDQGRECGYIGAGNSRIKSAILFSQINK